jgi:FkbM family methyltransferase
MRRAGLPRQRPPIICYNIAHNVGFSFGRQGPRFEAGSRAARNCRPIAAVVGERAPEAQQRGAPQVPDAFPALQPCDIDDIGRVWLREGTSDIAVLEQIFRSEEFNISTAPQFAWIRAAYDRMLAAGDTPLIVDCGANIGLSALYFALHLPKARIVGIEPARDNVELARRNTARNPLIEIIEAAVSDRPGRLEIVDPAAEKFAYRVREAGAESGGAVEAITIGALMQRYGAGRNLIVKVDIEGGERELFRSGTGWLDHTDLLIVETHDWLFPGQRTSSTLFSAIAGREFEVIQKGEYISFFFV